MHQILFVCMGNICRSPAGAGLFQAAVNRRKLQDRILVESAGTIDYHVGKPPDPRMQQAARRRGYELTGAARQVTRADLDRFDLVVAMDEDNLEYLRGLHPQPRAHLALLSEFLDDRWPREVPDPYYGGEQGFERVLDMLESACDNILRRLMENDG